MQHTFSHQPNTKALGTDAELSVLPVHQRERTSEPQTASEVRLF